MCFLSDHYESIQDELERRREECLQLRAVLANQSEDLKSVVALDSYRGNMDRLNEDGELLMAFETQKKLIRSAICGPTTVMARRSNGNSCSQAT